MFRKKSDELEHVQLPLGKHDVVELTVMVCNAGGDFIAIFDGKRVAKPERESQQLMLGDAFKLQSARRSERTKAGLQRAVSEGKRLGRPPGSKDRKKRSRRGYFLRWAE